MTAIVARRRAALVIFAALGLGVATSALADDKVVKIGVLNDMNSLYADIGGPNSVLAVVATISPEDAAKPLSASECPLVKK